MWLTNDHLVPEQLTDDQAQRGAAMSECHVKAFKIAELFGLAIEDVFTSPSKE